MKIPKIPEPKSKSYEDGYKAGLEWNYSHRPGGPYFSYGDKEETQTNRDYLEGFDAGLAEQKKAT